MTKLNLDWDQILRVFSSTFVYMYLYNTYMYQHIDKICFSSPGQKEILNLNCVY